MRNGSHVCKVILLRMEGEAIKESIVRGREQSVNGNPQSMSALRMIQPIL